MYTSLSLCRESAKYYHRTTKLNQLDLISAKSAISRGCVLIQGGTGVNVVASGGRFPPVKRSGIGAKELRSSI
jgi:hypothetical protein